MRWVFITCAILISNPTDAKDGKWGALVVAEEKMCTPSTREGKCLLKERIVARAWFNESSPERATEIALNICASTGITGCRVVEVFTDCGFITTGKNLAERKLKFAYGHDARRVLAECREDGFECHPPMGGCNGP